MDERLYELYHKNIDGFLHPRFVDGSTKEYEPDYKEYRRSETIENPLDDVSDPLRFLKKRRSFEDDTEGGPITKPDLFRIITSSYGISRPETEKRPVPSGGARYPLEIYLLVRSSTDMEGGIYHYNVREDCLERLQDLPDDTFSEHWYQLGPETAVSTMLIITADVERSATKYGERGYMFACIETGSVLQNIQLSSQAVGVKTRPYAGFNTGAIADLINCRDETIMLSVAMMADQTETSSQS